MFDVSMIGLIYLRVVEYLQSQGYPLTELCTRVEQRLLIISSHA